MAIATLASPIVSVPIRCSTSDFSFATVLAAGTWTVRVASGQYTSAAGVNVLPFGYLATDSLAISGPVSNLVLDERTQPVSGRVTVNGAAPTKNQSYCSQPSNANDEIAVVEVSEPRKG